MLNKRFIKDMLFGTTEEKWSSVGILISRIPFCLALFHYHGMEKVTGYSTMAPHFRDPIGLGPEFSLMYATLADSICSWLILFGVFTRPASFILFVNVVVAMIFVHPWEQRILLYIGYFGFTLLTGAGRYSLDFRFFANSREASAGHNPSTTFAQE